MNQLIALLLENNSNDINHIIIRGRMNIWIRSEIRVLEYLLEKKNIDYSHEIKKYKKLL